MAADRRDDEPGRAEVRGTHQGVGPGDPGRQGPVAPLRPHDVPPECRPGGSVLLHFPASDYRHAVPPVLADGAAVGRAAYHHAFHADERARDAIVRRWTRPLQPDV